MLKLTRIGMAVLCLVFALAVIGCERDGPAEQAGENIDEAAEKAGDKLEQAGDEIEEAAEEAEEEVDG